MSCENPCPLQSIDTAINRIKDLKSYLDDSFNKLNKLIENSEGNVQDVVDDIIVNEINPTINNLLADLRQSLLESLQEQYQWFTKSSSEASVFDMELSADLTKLYNFCMAVKNWFLEAYNKLLQFQMLLITHLTKLTTAISSIVSYQPTIYSPDINFDKLDIQCKPITLSDITGSDTLPELPVNNIGGNND